MATPRWPTSTFASLAQSKTSAQWHCSFLLPWNKTRRSLKWWERLLEQQCLYTKNNVQRQILYRCVAWILGSYERQAYEAKVPTPEEQPCQTPPPPLSFIRSIYWDFYFPPIFHMGKENIWISRAFYKICHVSNLYWVTHRSNSHKLSFWRLLDFFDMTKMTPERPKITPEIRNIPKSTNFWPFMQWLSSFRQTSWIKMLKTFNKAKIRCPVVIYE